MSLLNRSFLDHIMKRKIISFVSFVACLLTLGIYFYNTQFDKNQAYIDKVYEISRTVGSAQFDKIENLLVDYTIDNDIKKTIKNFLQQTLDQNLDNLTVQESFADTPQEGQSGDQIFFIRDKQDNLMFVVKVFSKPFDSEGNFRKELAGFGLLSKVDGNNFHLVTVRAIGKSVIDGERYGMLAISSASGTNMQTLVIDILRLPQGSPERLDALHTAQKGIKKLGAALAEFHQIHIQKDMPLDPAIFDRVHHDLSQIVGHLEQENHGIDIQVLQNYVAYLVQQMKKIKTTRSIIHGDAHLGNFLYDAKTDTISMVDYSELNRSVDREGNPVGHAAMDVMNMLDIIAANKKFGLTEEDANILREAFIKGYGSLPTNLEQDFFVLISRLGFVEWFLTAEKANPEQFTDDKLEKVSVYMLDEIKKSISKHF